MSTAAGSRLDAVATAPLSSQGHLSCTVPDAGVVAGCRLVGNSMLLAAPAPGSGVYEDVTVSYDTTSCGTLTQTGIFVYEAGKEHLAGNGSVIWLGKTGTVFLTSVTGAVELGLGDQSHIVPLDEIDVQPKCDLKLTVVPSVSAATISNWETQTNLLVARVDTAISWAESADKLDTWVKKWSSSDAADKSAVIADRDDWCKKNQAALAGGYLDARAAARCGALTTLTDQSQGVGVVRQMQTKANSDLAVAQGQLRQLQATMVKWGRDLSPGGKKAMNETPDT